jgi:carboxymethylenebutenolidase
VITLYDEFTHTAMPRRDFIKRVAALVGSVAAAETLLTLLRPNGALAQTVAPGDARIAVGRTGYPGAGVEMQAYLARPAAGGRHPGVVVIHENRGLNAHIEDVARRLAVAGFLALAPDALTHLGGTPDDPDQARNLIYELDGERTLQNYLAAARFLRDHQDGTGKVGCVGFCWGGGMSNQLAVHDSALNVAVVFYGASPTAAEAARIKAPLLLHYAGLDARINAGVPAYEAALKAAGVDYRIHTYAGVNHAFHNDTAAGRYDEAAAKLAWQRTVEFLRTRLAA